MINLENYRRDLNNVAVSGVVVEPPCQLQAHNGQPLLTLKLLHTLEQASTTLTCTFSAYVEGQDLVRAYKSRIKSGDHLIVVGKLLCQEDENGQPSDWIKAEDLHVTEASTEAAPVNAVKLAGCVEREAELEELPGGLRRMSLWLENRWESDWREEVSLAPIIAYNDTARKLARLPFKEGQHITVSGRLITMTERIEGESDQVVTRFAVVAQSLQLNDRYPVKRYSGFGNGAETFAHPSKRTSFDRYTNDYNPDFGRRY